jgi:hypothetical protein
MFIRFILYSLALYFIMKTVRIVFSYFNKVSAKEKPEVNTKKASSKVDKRDIIDADFEDISDKEN